MSEQSLVQTLASVRLLGRLFTARVVLLSPFLIVAPLILTAPAALGDIDQPTGAIELTEPGANGDLESYKEPQKSSPSLPAKGYKPVVGRKAAEKYMAPRKPASALSSDAHYLALHIGTFVSDNAYQWGGKDSVSNVGRGNLGVTYRVGEWTNSMDLAVRIDWLQYSLEEGRPSKLSFAPVVMFPDATSKFPLYFGGGAGVGIFMTQVNRESSLSLDYQIFAGARFFNIFDNTGFFVEGGLKNHILLLSDGQFNGTFAAAGAIFSF
jgi:hypothetical protein